MLNRQQQGMTLMGYVLILFVIGFFAIMAMKLTPLYLEYQAVVNVMEGASKESVSSTPAALRSTLGKRLGINQVTRVNAKDFKIRRDKGRVMISIDYEARTSFVGNIFFVVVFSHEVAVTGP